jgi:hypothetical protein
MAAVAPEADGEPVLGQVVGQPEPSPVEEPPAPVLGVVVGEEMEAAPQSEEMERAYEGTARGSVECLGRGLLSTEEISGDYWAACIWVDGDCKICDCMTVVPHGPDTIETWRTDCLFFPPFIGPVAEGAVRTRKPGTNKFGGMTFSADGTVSNGFIKRPDSQKRAFQKVETRDLAGRWCGCACLPLVLYFVGGCTTKRALNEDQYDESGLCCWLVLPIPVSGTRTRRYVNGHPTNGFDGKNCCGDPDTHWYRDPGCAAQPPCFFAKKVG